MFPWFVWNNKDSRDAGIWVTKLPSISRAEERVKRVKIPGRSGDVVITEGEDIYNSYVRECIITVDANKDYTDILSWLRGSGEVIFSNEPDRKYFARIVGAISFDRTHNSLHQATIQFYCQPLKGQYPPESSIDVVDSMEIVNPGDVYSKPIITLVGQGEASLTIGTYTMSFTNLPGMLIIDCDAEMITAMDDGVNAWNNVWEGEYFRIAPGINAVTISGCTASVAPNWRWI